jgi:hypothetical protein
VVSYFHVVERGDGRWACQHGLSAQDIHPDFDHAVAHIREIAGAHRPASIYAHPVDGPVKHIEDLS